MKLLYVMGSFYPTQIGGPNNTVYWQAKALTKKGVDVTVVTTMAGVTDKIQKEYNIQPNKPIKIDNIKVIFFSQNVKHYFSLSLFKWIVCNAGNYDLASLNSYFLPMSWVSAFVFILKKQKFFIAPRGELEDNALIYHHKIKKFMIFSFLKRLYSKSTFVLLTSQQELQFSKKFFKPDMEFKLLPNFIEIDKEPKKIKAKNKKNILLLSRIHPKKKVENLIKAYINLDENIKKKHKLIIAGGYSKQYYDFLISIVRQHNEESSISFVGHKDGKEKEELYKNSKIFVLPSESENFGNVVLEALMHKTPVITSIYTPWQEIEKHKCGFWIDNSPETIEKYIRKILSMKDTEYEKMSENAYKFVDRYYNIENNTQKIMDAFGIESKSNKNGN